MLSPLLRLASSAYPFVFVFNLCAADVDNRCRHCDVTYTSRCRAGDEVATESEAGAGAGTACKLSEAVKLHPGAQPKDVNVNRRRSAKLTAFCVHHPQLAPFPLCNPARLQLHFTLD